MALTPVDGPGYRASCITAGAKCSEAVKVEDAIFTGAVSLAYLTCEQPVVFRRCVFVDGLDLRQATFEKGLVLEACEFQGVSDCTGLLVKGDLVLDGSRFARSEWRGLNVTQDLCAYGVTFHDDALFSPIQIGNDAHFACLGSTRVTFCRTANFSAAVVNGQFNFSSASFQGPAYFQRAVAKGGLFALADQETWALPGAKKGVCDSPGCFEDSADFHGLEAKEMRFEGVTFRGPLTLEGARLTADLRCDSARFEGGCRFNGMNVAGQAVFSGARLVGRAQFRQAGFGEEAIFRGAVFEQTVEFSRAVFHSRATFGQEYDEEASVFRQDGDFQGATFKGEAYFGGTIFHGAALFRDVAARSLVFDAELAETAERGQFRGATDFRGCAWSDIRVAWDDLLRRQTPFDRLPYEEIGKTLRSQGRDRESRLVYQRMQERRLQEHRENREWLPWFRLGLFWVLGYGVRPWWLLGLAALLLGSFSLVFDNPGAVVAGEKGVAARALTWAESLAYCVRLFLPVDVPLGGAWKASEAAWFRLGAQPVVYTLPATLLKLAGAIVTPFGIAAVAGLFSRLKRG